MALPAGAILLEAQVDGDLPLAVPAERFGQPATAEARRRAFKEAFINRLSAQGLTVSDWARAHGFPVTQVSHVLNGQLKGRYGLSHRIAVALGLKEGEIA